MYPMIVLCVNRHGLRWFPNDRMESQPPTDRMPWQLLHHRLKKKVTIQPEESRPARPRRHECGRDYLEEVMGALGMEESEGRATGRLSLERLASMI